MNDIFMTEHPLRAKLNQKDWERIQAAIDSGDCSNVTVDELDAANDVFIDELATRTQTHTSVWVLH